MVNRSAARARNIRFLLLLSCSACGLLYLHKARSRDKSELHLSGTPDDRSLKESSEAETMGAASSSSGWKPSATENGPRKISKSGYDVTPLTLAKKESIAKSLSPTTRNIALQQGTERAFTGQTTNGYSHDNKQAGLYVSAVGGLPLFSSDTKYDSGTGWPSFFAPVDAEHVIEESDNSIPFMPRTEVLDARSGAHLGHVFFNERTVTGKRYCMNAAALTFIPKGEPLPAESQPANKQSQSAASS